jgi:acetyl-CoA carboxylase biotin carboxyl carrier protein
MTLGPTLIRKALSTPTSKSTTRRLRKSYTIQIHSLPAVNCVALRKQVRRRSPGRLVFMSEKDKSAGESFYLERLKQLIRLREKHDLTEIRLQRDDQKWVLRRASQSGESRQGMAPAQAAQTPAAPVPMSAGNSLAAPESRRAPEEELLKITSPTVGTFYASPQPGDPPFVKIGDRVTPETTVCIVEAMKVFNQIPAEVGGTIHRVLVNDGDAVEFGQALFLVKPG